MAAKVRPTPPNLRADAARNRARIIAAARDVFAEQGADAPIDDIVRRSGVGSATLYRRFPTRTDLIRAVALDLLLRSAAEGEAALAEEPDAFRALARYMHHALEIRISAVMPALAARIGDDPEIARARDRSAASVERMIVEAKRDGLLRPDVEFADIGLLLVRLSRPLPGPISRSLSDQIGHRHLELVLAGLRAAGRSDNPPLPGPALTLADLRNLRPALDAVAPEEDAP